VFSHASQPKKLLTQNVFLLNFLIFFGFLLTKIYQMCEHLVKIVQYSLTFGDILNFNKSDKKYGE